MKRNLIVATCAGLIVASFAVSTPFLIPAEAQTPMPEMTPAGHASPMGGMGGMDVDAPTVPPVRGYAEGQEIIFIHTEASDPQVAGMLTEMMGGSPVLVVPALAQAPATMLANVYVFTNGVTPAGATGPLGFQPDVFDRPPSDPGYSPLRTVNLVTWTDAATARVLTSAAEVQVAAQNRELTVERPEIVVNMPMLTWPGGQR